MGNTTDLSADHDTQRIGNRRDRLLRQPGFDTSPDLKAIDSIAQASGQEPERCGVKFRVVTVAGEQVRTGLPCFRVK